MQAKAVKAREARRARPRAVLSPRFAGHRIPSLPEGRRFLRRPW
jgi:hypothetical protein